jgi:hypothetical protein
VNQTLGESYKSTVTLAIRFQFGFQIPENGGQLKEFGLRVGLRKKDFKILHNIEIGNFDIQIIPSAGIGCLRSTNIFHSTSRFFS